MFVVVKQSPQRGSEGGPTLELFGQRESEAEPGHPWANEIDAHEAAEEFSSGALSHAGGTPSWGWAEIQVLPASP